MENSYNYTDERFAPGLVAGRLEKIRSELAALEAGRSKSAGPVKLLAVTKTVPVEVINYAIDELGIDAIGENRVQELLDKYDKLHSPKDKKLEIHLIGSLQTNKVKYIIDKVDMIESVDSPKLAAEIDRQAKKAGRVMDILLEVNIGREPQKGGIFPEQLYELISSIAGFDSLRLRGLMTIAPKSDEKSDYEKYFSETFRFFIDISEKISHNIIMGQIDLSHFDTLSMGMSGSWREAVYAGSNEIRIGSGIFGERSYPLG